MPLLHLATDSLSVTVDPERGAGLCGLRAFKSGRWLALMPEPDSSDLAGASFLMVPYSNRIADGRFSFAGRSYQLQNGENHAIHGDVRKRPWRVVEQGASVARLTFDSREHQGVNWPWPFSCEVRFEVERNAFRTHLTLRNESAAAMPAGLGFHPYFLRSLSPVVEPVRVQFCVEGVYPDGFGTRIPSGLALPPTPAQDFAVERELDPGAFHDFCAWGFDGHAQIAWPDSGVRIRFGCSPQLGHLVFYNPPKPYFAMEPVSNANDGVNLLARGDPTSGVEVLAPGAAMEAEFEVVVRTEG